MSSPTVYPSGDVVEFNVLLKEDGSIIKTIETISFEILPPDCTALGLVGHWIDDMQITLGNTGNKS